MGNILIDIGMWILLLGPLGVALLAGAVKILEIVKEKGGILRLIIVFVGVVVFLSLCYVISPGEILTSYTNSSAELISHKGSKVVGGSLIAFYILALTATGSILYRELIQKLFK